MIIKNAGRIYINTREASPEWECFRPAKECEHGENVVTINGIQGRWKYETSIDPVAIVAMVATECCSD